MIKLIERKIFKRLAYFIQDRQVLSPGFRWGCSIWNAHGNLEARIRLAQKGKMVSALVTLDAAKAYDSVEHSTLLNKLSRNNLPAYLFAWIREFLADREFLCTNERLFFRTDIDKL